MNGSLQSLVWRRAIADQKSRLILRRRLWDVGPNLRARTLVTMVVMLVPLRSTERGISGSGHRLQIRPCIDERDNVSSILLG